MQATKICNRCRQTLPVDRFNRRASASDGLQSACVPCRIEHNKELARRTLRHELGGRRHDLLTEIVRSVQP